jgi:hypothetical protein
MPRAAGVHFGTVGSAVAGISDLKHPLEYKKAPQPHAELLASD